MPHFYFDTNDGDRFLKDESGLDFADRYAARNAAMNALPDIARGVLPNGDRRTMAVLVRDETRKYIFEATLTLNAKWLDAT